MIKIILNLMRIEQYLKNLFIFAPIFFSFQFTGINFINSIIVFILFSLMASAVYIVNDIYDIKVDKFHPDKKKRPIASNLISITKAYLIFLVLAVISLTGSYIFNTAIFYILIIYLSINILYSMKLKNIPIIDILIIGAGFVLRLFAGGYAINEMITMWIISLTFILSLFIALAKRRADIHLSIQGKSIRKNIEFYNMNTLNKSLIYLSLLIIFIYILFTFSPEIIIKFGDNIYLTTLFVIAGLFRYLFLTLIKNVSGDPTKIFLTDRILQSTIIAWLIMFYYIAKGF